MATRFRISRQHLARLFKAETGQSIGVYRLQLQLERACQLLRFGELSVAQIAQECGWSDASHFSRSFTRHLGRSPGAYRRHWLGQAGLDQA